MTHAAPCERAMCFMRRPPLPTCWLQVRDYPAKKRDKWMFDWPSQIILVRSGRAWGPRAR